ncbi:hypothetical protein [Hydrogenophaga sp. A37]|uniref:hypothetical protein n=1 Tax=Hydrogenophaga sp. A37 TaxID=1945864 RepID=UPI0015C54038|nr:hypothetical protein [Hydrogenophaga sp. A37]
MLSMKVAHAEVSASAHTTSVVRELGTDCLATWSSGSAAPVVVMLISPRMVYSMSEWPRMRLAALAAGFEVVTWKAPGVSAQEWAQAAQATQWRRSQSALIGDVPPACTVWLRRLNHFPFSSVVLGDQVHEWPIWGVLSDEAWIDSLALRLESLKGQSAKNNRRLP